MKSYLRFLFVGIVLLVLLGLFDKQQSDHDVDRSEPAGLEQSLLPSGFLPLDPVNTVPQLFSSQSYPGGGLEGIWLKQEAYLSRLANNKFQKARWISGEISPDLLQRTGQFIHNNSGAVIPS